MAGAILAVGIHRDHVVALVERAAETAECEHERPLVAEIVGRRHDLHIGMDRHGRNGGVLAR